MSDVVHLHDAVGPPRLAVLRPSGSDAHPSMRLELLGNNAAVRMMVRFPSIVALCLPLEGLDLGDDSFMWAHPMCSNKELFMVDDVTE